MKVTPPWKQDMKMSRDNKSVEFQQLHLTPDMISTATILIAVPTNNLWNEDKQEC